MSETIKLPKITKNKFTRLYDRFSFVVVHDYPLVPDESVMSEVCAPPGESVVSKVFAP